MSDWLEVFVLVREHEKVHMYVMFHVVLVCLVCVRVLTNGTAARFLDVVRGTQILYTSYIYIYIPTALLIMIWSGASHLECLNALVVIMDDGE